MTSTLALIPIPGIPAIRPGDDLGSLLLSAVDEGGLSFVDGDVVVVAQKIVSKAENRIVALSSVVPSARALELAETTGKPAELVELILRESRRVVRAVRDVLIVEDRRGFVCANAGIDQSNVDHAAGPSALLLPEDPDGSAARLRERLRDLAGCDVAVVINDSFGRAWRTGTVGVALGVAGFPAIADRRGETDLFGRTLQATVIGLADEVAAAASLVMGGGAEGVPVVLVRGLRFDAWPQSSATSLLRPDGQDLFR